MISQNNIITAEQLLQQREAKGLRVPAMVRILFALFGLYSILAAREMIQLKEFLYATSIYGFFISANLYFLFALRNFKNIRFVGYAGLALDMVGIISYVIINVDIVVDAGYSPGVLAKDLLIVVCLTFIVINSLAMRPLYPAVLTLTTIVMHFYIWILAIKDPKTVWGAPAWEGTSVSHRLFASELIFYIIIGGALTILSWAARHTVKQAVNAQVERMQTMQQQTQLVMNAKLSAQGNLVAGISHEMNTPLGVVKNNADNLNRGLEKIRKSLNEMTKTGKYDPHIERVLDLLATSSGSSIEATSRLEETVKELRSFARLDESEYQQVDLRQELDKVLAYLSADLIKENRIEKNYDDIPKINCFPNRLNQVFTTLLTNAFEYMDETGCLTLSVEQADDWIVTKISDTGKGIQQDQLAGLFEVSFEHKGNRIASGFGLATAHSIIVQHGGEISVESLEGKGTTFTIKLPVDL